jgi:hypothetical protein
MPLAAGQSLTHYEILGPLGAGGMGEVYRAKDTRLEREVAIKVLPEELADDEERLRRFEREAKTLASLNHPNVAGIHGVDQVDDVCFLALELVPGEDLATRLPRGPLPVDEAIDVCRQIAEGLEAAHEAGVIHRDLKPANVRITPDGVAKILDFGLAKPIHPKTSSDGTATAESDSFLMTEEGLVLGTPTYMSPEQARGKPIDRRTDVWAFGCVFYECLTGRRAFGGESLTDIFAAIVDREPDWSALPVSTPPWVGKLLKRCLDKDARTRLRDVGEARVRLTLGADESAGADESSRGWVVRAMVLAAVLSVGAFVIGLGVGGRSDADTGSPADAGTGSPIIAFLHEFGADESPGRIAISPDGTRVAWSDSAGLYVRALDDSKPRTVYGEHREQWLEFAWSPDGRELAFLDGGAIWRVPVEGGPPTRFADYDGVFFTNLEWAEDGRIVYVVEEGIAAVSEGGASSLLAEIDEEVNHLDRFVLVPGSDLVVAVPHFNAGTTDTLEIFRGKEREVLVSAPRRNPSPVRVMRDGTLLWTEADGRLWSLPLDPENGKARGEAQLVAEGRPVPSVGDRGPLVYVEGDTVQEPGWVERVGGAFTSLGERYPHNSIWGASLSQDSEQIVFAVNDLSEASSETWVHDVKRGLSTPTIRRDDGAAISMFFPDGRIGVTALMTPTRTFAYLPTGKGDPEAHEKRVLAVSSDGTVLITSTSGLPDGQPTHFSGPGAEEDERLLLSGEHAEQFHELSRDGDWMLHSSKRTEDRQVFLTRFPPDEDEWPVSAEGGEAAWFGVEGAEILFLHEGLVHRVAFDPTSTSSLGIPEPLFELPANITLVDYDDTHGRFLAIRASGRRRVAVDTGWSGVGRTR